MPLFRNIGVMYSIFMRILPYFAACVFLISGGIPAWALAHALDYSQDENKVFAIDLIAAKQPLRYEIEDPLNPSNNYPIPGDYQKWFNNVLDRLDDKRKKEISGIIDILEFGASDAAYISDAQNPQITFHFKKTIEDIYASCIYGALACFNFSSNKMHIYALTPNEKTSYYTNLVHEIGHSLRMEDLYDEQLLPSAGEYGSGVKASIMSHHNRLTCDDADAIVNAVYLAKKLADPSWPDLQFTSFCNQNVSYRNARQKDRAPLIINYEGTRTIYTYCKNGEVKSITQITPSNYDNLVKTLKEPAQCQSVPLPLSSLNPNPKEAYRTVDFKTGEILSCGSAQTPQNFEEKIFYIPIPDSGGLYIQVKTDGKDIPAYIKIKDGKDQLLYLFAYLKEGYNLVYDSYLSGKFIPSYSATLFIYDRKNKSNYYVYGEDSWKGKHCQAPKRKCEKMSSLLAKYAGELSCKEGLIYPYFGGFPDGSPKKNIADASSWENFLLRNYPPQTVFLEEVKQDLKSIIKSWKQIKSPF